MRRGDSVWGGGGEGRSPNIGHHQKTGIGGGTGRCSLKRGSGAKCEQSFESQDLTEPGRKMEGCG